jgi:hypothetical protein
VPALNIIAAPTSATGDILDALQDLSAINMVRPFIWLSGLDQSGLDATASLVCAGERFTAPLSQLLSGADGLGEQRWSHAQPDSFDHLRLGVLVPAYAGIDQIGRKEAVDLSAAIQANHRLRQLPMERLRVYLADPAANPIKNADPFEGWHNLLLDPQDSSGPGAGPVAWAGGAEGRYFGRRAVPGICGLFALWHCNDKGPLDGKGPPSTKGVRLVRSFYRSVNASHVADQIRSQVLNLRAGLPTSTLPGELTQVASDVNRLMLLGADSFLTANNDQLGLKQPESPPEVKKPAVGAIQILKMFFSFLWSSIRGTVKSWPKRMADKIAGKGARGASRLVFGLNDPPVVVVVAGQRADGKPAGWREVGNCIVKVAQQLGLDTPGPDDTSDLGDVWKAYGRKATALADGSASGANTTVPMANAKRLIAATPAQIMPDPLDNPFEIDPLLAGELELARLEPGDVAEAQDFMRRLRELAGHPGLGARAGFELDRLEDWTSSIRDTFAHRVGQSIAGNLLEAQRRFSHSLDQIHALQARDAALDNAQVTAAQEKTRGRVVLLSRFFVGAAAAAILLGIFGAVGGLISAVIATASLIAWFVALIGALVSGQRDVFTALLRTRGLEPALEVHRRNLAQAYKDHERLKLAYGQYLTWTAVYGEFLNRPFGRGNVAPPKAPPAPVGLPQAVQSAVATVMPDVAASVTAALRQRVFVPGWLGWAWREVLESAVQTLGPEDALALADQPERLFADPLGANSPLVRWRALILEHGVGTWAADALWAKAEKHLEPGQPLRDDLIAAVIVAGQSQPQAAGSFVNGLHPPNTPADSADTSLLTDEAILQGQAAFAPDCSAYDVSTRDLGFTATLTQTTSVIPAHRIKLFAETPSEGLLSFNRFEGSGASEETTGTGRGF